MFEYERRLRGIVLSLRPRHPREARQHVNTRASKTGERAETHTVWGGHSLCASTLSTHIIYSVGHRCPQRAHTLGHCPQSEDTSARACPRPAPARGRFALFPPSYPSCHFFLGLGWAFSNYTFCTMVMDHTLHTRACHICIVEVWYTVTHRDYTYSHRKTTVCVQTWCQTCC